MFNFKRTFKIASIFSLLLLISACKGSDTKQNSAPSDTTLSDKEIQTTKIKCSFTDDGACINKNEEVELFNSYGYYDTTKKLWILNIKGLIFEPNNSSLVTSLFTKLLEQVVGKIENIPPFFDKRIAPFLVDNEGGERIIIKMGEKTYPLSPSEKSGLFTSKIELSEDEVQNILINNQEINYKVLMPENDSRLFEGKVFILKNDEGEIIISDIDDTLKVTEVTKGNSKIVENTFLNEMQVTSSMQSLFSTLSNEYPLATFHYVSGSPWQLYNQITGFLSSSNFYEGSLHLKALRINPLSSELYNFLDKESTFKHKVDTIEGMLQALPQKNFILIGDTGEKDPEIYAHLLKKHPKRILKIYLRNVTNESYDTTRIQSLFSNNLQLLEFISK